MATESKPDARRMMEIRDELAGLNDRLGALERHVSGLALAALSVVLLGTLFPTWFVDNGEEFSGWVSITTGLAEFSNEGERAVVVGVVVVGLLLATFVVAALGLRVATLDSPGWSRAAAIIGGAYGSGMVLLALLVLAMNAGYDNDNELGAGPWLAAIAGFAVAYAASSHRKNCRRD